MQSATASDNEAVTVSDSQSLYQSLATIHVIMHRRPTCKENVDPKS